MLRYTMLQRGAPCAFNNWLVLKKYIKTAVRQILLISFSVFQQLQQLKQTMKHKSGDIDQNQSSTCQKSERIQTNLESKEENSHSLTDYGGKEDMLSSNQDSRKTESAREETEVFNLAHYKDASIISSGWDSFESNRFLNESSCSSQWWEF